MKKIFTLALLCLITHWGFAQWTTNGTHIHNTNTGNVGIGLTNPALKLHVNGDIRVSSNRFFVATRTSGTIHTAFGLDGNDDLIFNLSAITAGRPASTIIGVAGAGKFIDFRKNGGASLMRVLEDGRVGVGTTDPGSFQLAVEGLVGAREIQVTIQNPFPDYVFASDYELMPLNELKAYINQHKHLPDIPSAKEVEEQGGIQLGDHYVNLLKKVEELTLYMIQQDEKTELLEAQTELLRQENELLKAQIKALQEK